MDDFLVKKLKSLKRVQPNSSWLESQRSFLISEINRQENVKKGPSLVLPLFNFNVLKILKPNFAIALAIIILITSLGTVGTITMAQNSLPGDFLYPVKTTLEKTQFTFASGEESKTKLSIKFATHRIDEFNQLIDNPENKEDIEKTVKNLTSQLVAAKENINKLKEKNVDKATEVARLVKTQTSIYEETLNKSSEELAYIIPEDKEDLKEGINQAVEANKALQEVSEELIGEEPLENLEEAIEELEQEKSEDLVPTENVENADAVESESFDNLEETIPQEEQTQEE